MALTETEAAELAALLAKRDAEPVTDAPAEVAGETAAEVGAAVAGAVGQVAQTVAAVTAEAVTEARRDEADRLAHEADVAKVDAALAAMATEEAQATAEAAIAGAAAVIVEAEPTVADVPEVSGDVSGDPVVIDAGDAVEDSPTPDAVTARPHPYYRRVRMPWQPK